MRWNSALTEARYKRVAQYGMPPRVMAQLEVWMLMDTFAYVIPTIFFMLRYIFADQSLLRDVRTEIEACTLKQEVKGT